MKICQVADCDQVNCARGLCRHHYNKIYWKQIAPEATIQNRAASYGRTREARKLPGWVPRSERVIDPEKKKMRIARQAALRRHMIRDMINQIKVLEGCIDCGYNESPVALDFDHQDGKEQGISRMVGSGQPIEALIKEVEKCVVRCANCHRIKTWANKETYEWLKPRLVGWEDYYYPEETEL